MKLLEILRTSFRLTATKKNVLNRISKYHAPLNMSRLAKIVQVCQKYSSPSPDFLRCLAGVECDSRISVFFGA